MMGVEHIAVLSGSEFSPSPHHDDQGHPHLMGEHSSYLIMTRVIPLPRGEHSSYLIMTRVVPLPMEEH